MHPLSDPDVLIGSTVVYTAEVVLEMCTFKSSILESMHSCYIVIIPT